MAIVLAAFYNVDTQRFCDSDGAPLAIEQLPRITLSQQALLALTCLRNDGTPAAFNPTDVFAWAADRDWDGATGPLLQTPSARINNPADWAAADPAAGRVGILVDADTAELQAALGASEEIAIYGELQVFASGAARPCYIGQMELRARNLVDHGAVTAPSVPGNYYSKAQIDALLAACLPLAGGTLSGDVDADGAARLLNLLGLSFAGATELTVASGAVTPTGPVHAVDTEADAATDTLDTIGTWTGLLLLYLANPARVVTLAHGTGANQVSTSDGQPLELSAYGLVLLYRETTGDAWRVLAGGGGTVDAEDVAVAGTPSNYTAATPDVEAHLAGIDTALGSVGGGSGGGVPIADKFIEDVTLASAATSCDLTGLSLQPGKHYRLLIDLYGTAAMTAARLFVNGDYTVGNYSCSGIYASDGVVGHTGGAAGNQLWRRTGSGSAHVSLASIIAISPSGYPSIQTQGSDVAGGATGFAYVGGLTYDGGGTISSITALRLDLGGTEQLQIGTRIRLCELRDVQGAGGAAQFGYQPLDKYNPYLAAWYPLGEAAGDRYDLVHRAALEEVNTVGSAAGKQGDAASFVGANSEYLLGASPVGRFARNVVVSAWVKTGSDVTTDQWIVYLSNYTVYAQLNLSLDTGKFRGMTSYNTTQVTMSSTTDLAADTWYHLVHVADWANGACYLYVNGTEEDTDALGGTPARSADLYVGAGHNGTLYGHFTGLVDELGIWEDIPFKDAAAIDAFAAALYHSGNGRFLE